MLSNKQKTNNNRNIRSARNLSTSTVNMPKNITYGDMFMETTSNMNIETNNSYRNTLLYQINNQGFPNSNEKPFNMEYQVAADMMKQDSITFCGKKMPDLEIKPTPENNSLYKVDFYPVISGVANFITGIFNHITGGGWVFSNKNTTSDKREKAEMFTPAHYTGEEEISDNYLFEEFSCERHQTFFLANEISLKNIKSTSENDVMVASINSKVEYQNKTVAAEQSALLNSFQSCRQRSNLPSFIPDQSTHDNINESENNSQIIEKERNKEMNSQNQQPNCTQAVEICEDKLAKIKDILKKGGSNKQVNDSSKTKSNRNRRRRMFVPPNSIKIDFLEDIVPVIENPPEHMQNIIVTNFSHPGLVVEPEIVKIEPAMTLVNQNVNATDEVDFCTTNDMKTCCDIKEKTCPKVNLNKHHQVYLDSLKGYNQDCLFQEAQGRIGSATEINAELAMKTDKITQLSTSISVINEKMEFGNTCAVIDLQSTSIPEESSNESTQTLKKAVISSCEDKMARLKEILSKRKEKTNKDCNANPIQDNNGNHQICVDAKKLGYENMEQINFASVVTKKSSPKPVHTKDKHRKKKNKNPNHASTNKDKGRRLLRRNIDEDISLGRDLNALHLSSSLEDECPSPKFRQKKKDRARAKEKHEIDENPRALNIPECAFDEVRGKFKKTVSDCSSDDSFIIVFTESPVATPPIEKTLGRQRMISDAGSEDSFVICFESDSENGNCYTNTDVFDECDTESDSDLETETSDIDSVSDVSFDGDSMSNLVNCSFGNSMSRTVSNLTDESLYADDSVLAPISTCDSDDGLDKYERYCGRPMKYSKDRVVSCMNSSQKQECNKDESAVVTSTDKPVKKVRFSEAAPQVLVLRVWAYAARAARAGPWERAARDRERFKRRIFDVDMAISWVLKPQHRTRVKFQRFMPWWNALRRQEVAEKKKKAEEDKIKEVEENRVQVEDEGVSEDHEDMQDNIEKELGEMNIRQEESRIRGEVSIIISDESKINEEERLCNGYSENNNTDKVNVIESPENHCDNNQNLIKYNANEENISVHDITVPDKQKTFQETNKQNLYAIQVYDTYKGEKFIENCIDLKKILIEN